MLAFSCGVQGKWEESETIFPPIAFTKGIPDIRPFHGLYALSMVHFNNSDYKTATKYCKRAARGHRRLLGSSTLSISIACIPLRLFMIQEVTLCLRRAVALSFRVV
jgi:hypothetical protein